MSYNVKWLSSIMIILIPWHEIYFWKVSYNIIFLFALFFYFFYFPQRIFRKKNCIKKRDWWTKLIFYAITFKCASSWFKLKMIDIPCTRMMYIRDITYNWSYVFFLVVGNIMYYYYYYSFVLIIVHYEHFF